MKKYLPLLILIILIVGGILAYQYWWRNLEKPIGGDKDEHGCFLMAGYSWCEVKQKCLRVWEEGCGATNQPVSSENLPQDKETCETQGGEWDRFGLAIKEKCNLPTSDAGKTCINQNECEGSCLVDLSEEESIVRDKEQDLFDKCSNSLNATIKLRKEVENAPAPGEAGS